jgi:hypothetical protein
MSSTGAGPAGKTAAASVRVFDLVDAGLTSLAALRAAAVLPARYVGLADPGNFSEYYADMDCIVDDQLWTPEDLEGARPVRLGTAATPVLPAPRGPRGHDDRRPRPRLTRPARAQARGRSSISGSRRPRRRDTLALKRRHREQREAVRHHAPALRTPAWMRSRVRRPIWLIAGLLWA